MRITDLHESKSAPLYHGTNLLFVAAIVASNELSAGMMWGRKGEPNGPRLTRNYGVAMTFANDNEFTMGGVLVLDQGRISNNHRIQPYRDVDAQGEAWPNEYEEVPLTQALKPLSRFLVSINCNPDHIREVLADDDAIAFGVSDSPLQVICAFQTIEQGRQELTQLLHHPLLNAQVPRGRQTPLGWRV